MGVIEGMRSGVDTPWMKLIFFIIVVTFIFWGSYGQGESTQRVALVNGRVITDTQFNQQLRRVANRLGAGASDAELAAARQQVMSSLVMETVLLQEAARLGIEVSDNEIADQLKAYTTVYGTLVRVPFTAFLDDFSTAQARSEEFAARVLGEWEEDGVLPEEELALKGIQPYGPLNLGTDPGRYEMFGLGSEVLDEVMRAPGGVTLYRMSTVSNEPVLAELRVDSFRGDDGAFSIELYEADLTRAGLTRPKYEQGLRKELTINKLLEFAQLSVSVHPHQVESRYREQNTQLGLDWIRVSAEAAAPDVVITDDDVAALVAADADRLRVRYAEQLDRRFRTPRQATFSTLLLRTDIEGNTTGEVQARVAALREQAVGGADFAELARTWSEDLSAGRGGDLGTQAEDQIDPVLAEALFQTEAGGFSEIVETSRGLQFLWVREIAEATETSFEEAAPLLARELLDEERTPIAVAALAQRLQVAWSTEDMPPTEMMLERGLGLGTASQLPVSATVLPDLGSMPDLMAAAAAAEEGAVLGELFELDGDIVVAQLRERDEPDMTAFETERDDLRRSLLFETRNQFIEEWRSDLVAGADVEIYL